jgi:hypothetical protein
MYGCVAVNPTGPASDVIAQFMMFVVKVFVSATGPKLHERFPAMIYSFS